MPLRIEKRPQDLGVDEWAVCVCPASDLDGDDWFEIRVGGFAYVDAHQDIQEQCT
jgi:hypothetical protein